MQFFSNLAFLNLIISTIMKNRISLIIVIIFLSVGTGFSQFSLSFGGKIGGASTNLTGVGLKEFVPTPKVKLLGGGVVNFAYGRRFALQTEFIYSGKGSAFSYYADNSFVRGQITIEQKLGYFAMPVMLQFKMGDKHNYFHFDAGIVFNTLVYEKYSGTIIIVDDKGNEVEQDYPIAQSPNKQDLGYAFGIGLVANGLNFDFRYEIGTENVFNPEEGAPQIINRSFQVSIGYTIRY